MIKRIAIVAVVCFSVAGSMAQAISVPTDTATKVIHGTIIDNHCAAANKDSLATFIKTHTKDCALMPACEASGYAIYTKEGRLHPFIHQNTATIAEFLKNPKNTLSVVVTAKAAGDSLQLETIKESEAAAKPPVKPSEKPAKKAM